MFHLDSHISLGHIYHSIHYSSVVTLHQQCEKGKLVIMQNSLSLFNIILFTARSELQKVLFLVPSVCSFFFVLVWNISETNERIGAKLTWKTCLVYLARTRLKVKVKDQGHQGQKRHFSALSAALRFIFSKTSLASSYFCSAVCSSQPYMSSK